MAWPTFRAAAATAALAVLLVACAMIPGLAAQKEHTQTFRSPSFTLSPGDVIQKFFTVDMPQGHIAIRSFNAHVVDENGLPVTLSDTYLHHWVLKRYYSPRSTSAFREPIVASNSGVCGSDRLVQLYGLGSETRRTSTEIPAPYGIVVGDAEEVPDGYDEIWVLNVHAIDTRGAVDRRGCTECVCDLYNMTDKVPAEYEGGLHCCFDEAHCDVLPDFEGGKRKMFMEYYVTWVEMSDAVVPVSVYILDVTDGTNTANAKHNCKAEYTVHKCPEGESTCLDKKENVNFLPHGGDVIYAVGHQHTGGLGSTLYNEDGEEICASIPTYGNGTEAGNEVGYIVGMSTCYPRPGTKKIRAGEELRLTSLYNNEDRHTGVMGLFYLLIDESQAPSPKDGSRENVMLVVAALIAAVVLIGAVVANHLRTRRGGPEYEQINV